MEKTTIRYYQDDIRPLVFDHNTFSLHARGKLPPKTWDIIFVDFVGYDATRSTRNLTYYDYLIRLQSRIQNKLCPTTKRNLDDEDGRELIEYTFHDSLKSASSFYKESFLRSKYRDNTQN